MITTALAYHLPYWQLMLLLWLCMMFNHVLYNIIGVALSREAVWSRVERMTALQAHHFGLNLHLSQNTIDNIMHTQDSGGLQAIKMFADWKRSCDLSDEPAIEFLNNAIENAYQNTSTTNNTSRQQRERKCYSFTVVICSYIRHSCRL